MKNVNFYIGQDYSLSSFTNPSDRDQLDHFAKHPKALAEQKLRCPTADWANLPHDLIGRVLHQPTSMMRQTCINWRNFTTWHLRDLRPSKRIKTEQLGELAQKFPQLTQLSLNACIEINATDLCHLKSLTQLRSLNLANGWTAGDEELVSLNSLIYLTKLDLSSWTFKGSCNLLEMQNLTQLSSLTLCRCKGIGKEVLQGIAHLQSLVSLDLAHCKQTETGELALLSSLKLLTRLDLTRCRGNDATLIALSSLNKISELNLTGFSNLSEKGFCALRNFQLLRHAIFSDSKKICIRTLQLGLSGRPLSVLDLKGCESLCKESYELIGKITSLRALTLSHSSCMNDENCQLLNSLNNLRYLDLSSTFVTEKSFEQFSRWSNLQSLCLNQCCMLQFDQLTQLQPLHQLSSLNASMRASSSASALWALTHIGGLNALKLWGNQTASDQALSALTNLPRLKHLQLANFPQVTEMGLDNLLKLGQLRSLRCMAFDHIGEKSRRRLGQKRKSVEIDFQ